MSLIITIHHRVAIAVRRAVVPEAAVIGADVSDHALVPAGPALRLGASVAAVPVIVAAAGIIALEAGGVAASDAVIQGGVHPHAALGLTAVLAIDAAGLAADPAVGIDAGGMHIDSQISVSTHSPELQSVDV